MYECGETWQRASTFVAVLFEKRSSASHRDLMPPSYVCLRWKADSDPSGLTEVSHYHHPLAAPSLSKLVRYLTIKRFVGYVLATNVTKICNCVYVCFNLLLLYL